MGWMLRGLDGRDRAFVGRDAHPDASSRERHLALGHWSASSSTGRTGTGSTGMPGSSHRRTRPAPRRVACSTTMTAVAGRLRHQLHVLARAAAPHRHRPGATRPRLSPGSQVQPRAHHQPSPRAVAAHVARLPLFNPDERRRRPMTAPTTPPAPSTYDAIVVGGGHNGLVNGAYLAKAGLRTLDPGAAPPRRRRGDHRGAASRLLVHHVLVRAQPAAAGDHPGARARQARLPAAAHAVVVPPHRGRRLPASWATTMTTTSRRSGATRRHDADAYDRYHHDLDRVVRPSARSSTTRRRTSSARTPRTSLDARRPAAAARRRREEDCTTWYGC